MLVIYYLFGRNMVNFSSKSPQRPITGQRKGQNRAISNTLSLFFYNIITLTNFSVQPVFDS
jgi:hypothetical protein